MSKLRISLYAVAMLFFLLSLSQEAYQIANQDWVSGLYAFLAGWLGMTSSIAALVWLANPLLILSWLTHKHKHWTFAYSVSALLLALSFMNADQIIASEAGNTATIDHLGLGYWWWLLSMLLTVTASIIGIYLQTADNQITTGNVKST